MSAKKDIQPGKVKRTFASDTGNVFRTIPGGEVVLPAHVCKCKMNHTTTTPFPYLLADRRRKVALPLMQLNWQQLNFRLCRPEHFLVISEWMRGQMLQEVVLNKRSIFLGFSITNWVNQFTQFTKRYISFCIGKWFHGYLFNLPCAFFFAILFMSLNSNSRFFFFDWFFYNFPFIVITMCYVNDVNDLLNHVAKWLPAATLKWSKSPKIIVQTSKKQNTDYMDFRQFGTLFRTAKFAPGDH